MPNSDPKLELLLRAIIAGVGRRTKEPVISWNEELCAFKIQVNAHDQGRFIGKDGIAIWAINAIFWYAGMAQIKRTVGVALLDPEGPRQRPILFRSNPKWDRRIIEEMVRAILATCFPDVITQFGIKETEETQAVVFVQLNKYLETPCSDPNLAEAIDVIVHAAGMADGVAIKTEITFK